MYESVGLQYLANALDYLSIPYIKEDICFMRDTEILWYSSSAFNFVNSHRENRNRG